MNQNLSFRLIFPVILLLALFSIVILKAYNVPITYDEVASTIYYPQFSIWQIMMYPDNWPSNHILNTLLIKLSFNLFGISAFAARLPNILGFLFYYAIVWSIAYRWFRNSWLYYAVLICLTCNPYFLDFFGLARGYAMSNTFMAGAVYFILRFAEERRIKFFWLSYFCGMLASYANFTLLIFFAALNGVLFLFLITEWFTERTSRRKKTRMFTFLILLDVAYGALIASPIHKMNSTNQFIYWSSNGIISDTLKSIISDSLYGINYPLISVDGIADVCLIIFCLLAGFTFWRLFKRKYAALNDLFVIGSLMLLATLIVNILQSLILKTPNLYGRTAMSYFPLFMIPVLFLLESFLQTRKHAAAVVAISLCLILAYHQVKATNTRYVFEWKYDQHTGDIINYLNSYRTEHNLQSVSLNTSWWFNPSFSFYQKTSASWIDLTPYHKDIDTTSNTPFFYATSEDYDKLKDKYDVVINFDEGERMLLQHR